MTLKNRKGYGVIYKITNLVNGKKYIGQTSKYYINDRWSQHKNYAKNNKRKGYLYNAMRKYGIENFEFKVILHNIPVEQLNFYEQLWINKLKTKAPNGYNLTDGGGGTRGLIPWNKGIARSEETINKIKSHYTPEVRAEMSKRMSGENNPNYGKRGRKGIQRYGEENPFFGKHHTEETKILLSELQSNKKQKVAMVDIDTEKILLIFDSYAEATRYLKKNTQYTKADDSAISKCARGIYTCVYGYKWSKIE